MSESATTGMLQARRGAHVLNEAFFQKHYQEAAMILEEHPVADILRILQGTTAKNAANLLSSITPPVAAETLTVMPTELLKQVIPYLSPSLAASLFQRLEEDLQRAILFRIPERYAQEIRSYMTYPPESVGSIMDPRFFVLQEDMTVREAMLQVRSRAQKDIHDVYVIDRFQKLVGKFSVRDLLLVDPEEKLQSVMNRDLPTIHPLESREEIVELFGERHFFTIPVVDLDQRLLGVVRNEDIIKASQEDATADLQTMVGANKDERALSPVWFSVRKRLPWLQLNLLTAFLASFVVGMFESTIAQFTALAVLLPIVAGQSGNTGAQSLAVVIRGLALRDIRPSQWLRVCGKEVYVAFFNSLAVAAAACLAVGMWSRSFGLTVIIGVSMVISMVIAGLSGAIIPIALKALKQDPAQSSSIVLTTVTDVVGFFSFLGLATIFSSLLAS
ncbi:MAG: magnesium transporter [Nitrospira sp.]|nr:magnesium transporter [Nitrospira sp.]MCB9711264.1 magnesium transporter [Nitrospiraceae bacterium]MDR4486730.1 magnesium transporter [Nitrospirales bacterium]MCA9465098.1 magnesium transporter [Nitrospira sp.]MCA9480927.1 magnesium transporter [Nitrospira sp.]